MFGLSGEHLLLLFLVLLFFGPQKLPLLGSALGKATRNFRDFFRGGIHEPEYRKLGDEEIDKNG